MSQEQFSTQTVVIGAGVVGLAIARALARSGREVLVLEAGVRIGEGVSSRNSEVIHAGIYYPSDSLKARVCVAGRQRLYEFCASHKVAHRKCGKWIVASDEVQAGRLDDIQAGAASNGVALEAYDAATLSRRLPFIQACRGLWSPETGIVDSHGLMLALLGDLEDAGGQLAVNSPVVAAESGSQGHVLTVGEAGELLLGAREVINAAGLGAPRLAALWAGLPESGQPQQWLARGVYFSFSGKHPFDTLVYPLPEPGGLGIHLTLDLAGQARFGPDVEWVDDEQYQVDPRRARSFADSIRRWWPGLDESRLQQAYAGIRPKLVGPDGGFADFRIDGPDDHGVEGLVNLFGIESPGLTSCLALADHVMTKLSG